MHRGLNATGIARVLLIGVAGCFLVLTGGRQAAAQGTVLPRVLLISLDGVQKELLQNSAVWTEKDSSGDPAPCWEDTKSTQMPTDTGDKDGEGNPIYSCMPTVYSQFSIIASRTCDGKTMTKPQHVCMMTGLTQEQSGVTRNNGAARIPVGASVFEVIADYFDPVPEGERHNELPIHMTMVSWQRYVGRAVGFWARRTRALEAVKGHGFGLHGPTKRMYKIWDRIEEKDPGAFFFSFVHYKSIDWAGHVSGTGSLDYRRTLMQADAEIAELLTMLDDRGWGDAVVILATDHGFGPNRRQHSTFSGSGPPDEEFPVTDMWMAFRRHDSVSFVDGVVDGDISRTAEITDVAPTILDILEIPQPPDMGGVSLVAH